MFIVNVTCEVPEEAIINFVKQHLDMTITSAEELETLLSEHNTAWETFLDGVKDEEYKDNNVSISVDREEEE